MQILKFYLHSVEMILSSSHLLYASWATFGNEDKYVKSCQRLSRNDREFLSHLCSREIEISVRSLIVLHGALRLAEGLLVGFPGALQIADLAG